MKTYTASEAAQKLNVDVSRILKLCRDQRLGYSNPKFGRAWVITDAEIARYIALGPNPSGRPANLQ